MFCIFVCACVYSSYLHTHTHAYIYIYIYGKINLVTIVDGDPKAAFSIAAISRCR